MKRTCAVLILLLAGTGLAAKTLVLPLAVNTQDHASLQWLGKALSFYMIAGLGQNGLPVAEEEEVQALLNRSLVRFPYAIAKATAMTLAGESRAGQLLWGKVLFSERSERKPVQLQVQLFLIDIPGGTQRHLPPVKGNANDMFSLQEELLRQVLKAVAPGLREVVLPKLNLGLPEYEKLIKSLLLADADKKLELLQPAPGQASRSDFVNFELAKAFLQKRDTAACRSLLERVGDAPFFSDRKEFLLALAEQYGGDADAALNRFVRLQQRNAFPAPTHNNLGVLYMGRGSFPLAEKCLRYALYLRSDPGIRANLVLLQREMGAPAAALGELTTALRQFPDDPGLLRLFAHFVAAAENRDALGQVFRDYVRLPLPEEALPAVEARVMDPFGTAAAPSEAAPANLAYIEARNLFLESDIDGALQKAEEAMEANPFDPQNLHLLALLSLQKQQAGRADLFAQGALFLAESLDNYLLQLKVLQASGERERFGAILERALGRFPQSPELLGLGGRGR
jgi:tetratricopeptide (TPR) repeat protein